jgi:hypothetical protein
VSRELHAVDRSRATTDCKLRRALHQYETKEAGFEKLEFKVYVKSTDLDSTRLGSDSPPRHIYLASSLVVRSIGHCFDYTN